MKRRSGINMSDVKTSNRSLILNQLKNKPKSRKDIADKINLTPAAVTILVNELIEQGCIKESGQVSEPTRVGRKKVLVELNKTYKYAIGINIEGSNVSIGVGNLKGEILTSRVIEFKKVKPEENLITVAQIVKELLFKMEITREDVLGIGVGVVGVVDTEQGISVNSFGVWSEEVRVKEIIQRELQMSVVLKNNVRSLALAEMDLKENRKLSNMVFIKVGRGLGSAVILNNEIYEGSNNTSGEIGHMIIGNNDLTCRCGQKGCLETVASVSGLKKSITESYNDTDYPVLHQMIAGNLAELTLENIVTAYHHGDAGVQGRVTTFIEFLAVGIVNIIKMYDPKKIVIYGEMFKDRHFMERLIDHIRTCYQVLDVEERIVTSHLPDDKCIGGVVTVIRELFYNNGALLINQLN